MLSRQTNNQNPANHQPKLKPSKWKQTITRLQYKSNNKLGIYNKQNQINLCANNKQAQYTQNNNQNHTNQNQSKPNQTTIKSQAIKQKDTQTMQTTTNI